MGTEKRVILASKSPRRIELFEKYGICAESCPADIDETLPDSLALPREIVEYLALKKARAVAQKYTDGEIIIAADTLVFADDKILGKPKDKDDARDMMRLLSGNTHSVLSGICIICGDKTVTESVRTTVTFKSLSQGEIESYISTPDPYDKAGGYGIQSLGGAFVQEIHGDYYNVVGLPISRLLELLKVEFDYPVFEELCANYTEQGR